MTRWPTYRWTPRSARPGAPSRSPLLEAAQAAAEDLGIAVGDVVVKDVIVPAEPRTAYAQLVAGRHQAQLKLEQARAETAALRSLANAAKLLDAHPALARQLLVEALPYGASLKVALGECAVGVMGPPRHPTRLS